MRTARRLAWPLGAALAIPVMAGSVPAATAAEAAPAPVAAEGFGYPDAAKVLADRNITLTAGDGHIVLADCASGPGLVQLYSRTANPSLVCFRITGPTGYLALQIPQVYNIKGDDHTIKATLNTAGTVSSLDVNKNAWTPVGEGDATSSTTLLELNATDGPAAPAAGTDYQAVGTVAFGQPGHPGSRSCTAALVDRNWVLTAASCFGDNPAAGAPATASTATIAGHTVGIAELATRGDRDLVMARLATPVDGLTPLAVSATAPAAGDSLRVPGHGRTATEWAPFQVHTTTHTVGAVAATGIDTAPAAGAAALCQGDAGAPLLRDRNGTPEIAAVAVRSWQGGCLGTPATETRTGATSSRVDDLGAWVQQVRATATGWKTQALVKGDNGLFQATRLYDGSWTAFQDVQATAGSIGGVKSVAAAGINGDTHVLALGGDGRLHHSLRKPDGTWSAFGDVNQAAGELGNITQVSASSIGADLHVVVLAGGQVFHTVRHADGTWTGFGAVFGAAGPLNGVTSVAAAGTGSELQVAAVAGGTVQHTVRAADGTWSGWGSVADAAGPIGTVASVAMARQGGDMDLVAVTSTGAQFHTIRFADRTWQPFRPLTGVLGNITAASVSAAPVDGDAQFAVTTTDNRVLTTARHADGTWAPVQTPDLTAVPGNHTGTAITGTL
ncbi:trypsin-like serine protease [Kitasatospora sp. NPDC059722]|uniref:trypsin-like serine protease n=1 Tax=unclassified Kitasatospora TaxID=2633591 RepID=UPI003699575F